MKHTKHSAFSMVELVFVIVVLGIVASIGSSIIAKTFETYIIQKATYNASMKTEIAVQQIANRLSHAIPWTFVAKNPTVANPFNNFIILKEAPPADLVHTALEWVGVDNDSFSAVTPPGWSGYCDIDTSNPGQCDAQGSNPDFTATVITNLSGPNNPATIADSAIFFKTSYYNNAGPLLYEPECIGLVDDGTGIKNTNCAVGVTGFAAGTPPLLTFDDANPKIRAEQYALSWSAYTLEPVFVRAAPDGTRLYDLNLVYNYRPWAGNDYNIQGTRSTLINNVSVFKFTQVGNTIRFKLCVLQQIGTQNGEQITICKEKAVIR